MRNFSKLFLSTAVLAMSFSTPASAKLPDEVMTPYKAYRTAMTEGDRKKARENALKAWEAAEEHLGDHKTTGDLALNYANISPESGQKNGYKNYEKRAEAYKRAIELSSFYGDDAAVREVERRVFLADLELTVARRKSYKGRDSRSVGKINVLKDLEEAIAKHSLQGTTFDGDLNALYAQYYAENEQPEKSIEYANKSVSIFDNRTDDLFSKYEFMVRFFKGDSHSLLARRKKDDNQQILAALEYQYVMQNLEGQLEAEHPFINAAFKKWMKSRSELKTKGYCQTLSKPASVSAGPLRITRTKLSHWNVCRVECQTRHCAWAGPVM